MGNALILGHVFLEAHLCPQTPEKHGELDGPYCLLSVRCAPLFAPYQLLLRWQVGTHHDE